MGRYIRNKVFVSPEGIIAFLHMLDWLFRSACPGLEFDLIVNP
jgi:hypothetical protein